MQSGEMKLEDAKKLQNIFKSNLKKISKWRFKSKEGKSTLENIELLHESWQAELLLNYLMIILQFYLKLKTKWNIEKDWIC